MKRSGKTPGSRGAPPPEEGRRSGPSATAAVMLALFVTGAVLVISQQKAPAARELDEIIAECAKKHGVEAELIKAVISVESRGRQEVVSKAGAVGLMQVMPSTAAFISREMGLPAPSKKDLYDPSVNISFGSWYLARMRKTFGDDHLALAAYNAGPGNVKKWMAASKGLAGSEVVRKQGFPQTKAYVEKVMAAWRRNLAP